MSGRPLKAGLDYFELDCHMEDKVGLIQAEFGLKGFAVVVKLYQKIYGGFGYYCEWSEDSLLLFLSENGLSSDSANLIKEIVSACIKRGIFSEELFKKFGILTSSGVQKRYLNATSRREKVDLKKEYLLISVPKNRKNVCNNPISVDINRINVCRNSQSREEKSKEEYSIYSPLPPSRGEEEKETTKRFIPPTVEQVKAYCLERGNGIDAQAFIDYYDASGWMRGRTKIKDWKACVRSWEHRRRDKKGGKPVKDLNNFQRRQYDMDVLEKRLMEGE